MDQKKISIKGDKKKKKNGNCIFKLTNQQCFIKVSKPLPESDGKFPEGADNADYNLGNGLKVEGGDARMAALNLLKREFPKLASGGESIPAASFPETYLPSLSGRTHKLPYGVIPPEGKV